MAKVITFGEIMLRLATPGYLRFSQVRQFEATFGGGEANVAVSLANYGLEADFVTRFPKSTVATITGIGGLAAGTSSFLINKGAGMLFTYSENAGAAYSFLGFEGKEAGYMTVFCICAVAYLVAWVFMKVLVPVYKKIEL